VFGNKPPCRRLALGEELLDELVERDVTVLDARSRAERGVERLGVAIVEYLHAPVVGTSPRGCGQHGCGENRSDRRNDGYTSRTHLHSNRCGCGATLLHAESRVKCHPDGPSFFRMAGIQDVGLVVC
jgi:hypothetical protein